MTDYDKTIEYTDSAKIDRIVKALIDNRYTDVIDGLRPNSTISINPSQDGFIDIYLQYPNDFIGVLREAIYRVKTQKDGNYDLVSSSFAGIKIDLIGELLTNMHDINTKHENVTVSFECQVLATDSPKSYIKEAKFDCPLCGNEDESKCNIDRVIVPPVCSNTACKKAKMMIRTSEMITELDYIHEHQSVYTTKKFWKHDPHYSKFV